MGNYTEFKKTYDGENVMRIAAAHFEQLRTSLGKLYPTIATLPVSRDPHDYIVGSTIYDGTQGIYRIHLQLCGYIHADSQSASIAIKTWHREEEATAGLKRIVDDALQLGMQHMTFPVPTGKFPRIPKSELMQ